MAQFMSSNFQWAFCLVHMASQAVFIADRQTLMSMVRRPPEAHREQWVHWDTANRPCPVT
jgi:hypothetical protein